MKSGDILDLRPDSPYLPEKGRLLVSEPYLPDPYFKRTVVLLCEHNAEGSFGFVLNRHMDMQVHDLLDTMPVVSSRVGIGGPVQSSDLFYLHTLGPRIEGSAELVDGVYMGGDHDQLCAVLKADPRLAVHVRFFVGYSGWGEDQLQRELDERSWLIARADRRTVMHTGHKDLWADTLRGMGRAFAPLANFPDDPALN